ncbi:hypothetical protein Bhyg_05461 [Pseudolycoriella hygida]|uniref:Uncharacterized protein n=1 Tax=Pseudolycoriella hygida TaxID=35572 RepID=A0A9Q0N075_9DIPT|nr:hypothetical protein Bhyg_05461 [Pseudolycoriella hygida]
MTHADDETFEETFEDQNGFTCEPSEETILDADKEEESTTKRTKEKEEAIHTTATHTATYSLQLNCRISLPSENQELQTENYQLYHHQKIKSYKQKIINYIIICSIAQRDVCTIDYYNKAVTVHNFKTNCNNKELLNMFSNLKAGSFPPNSRFKGHILACPSGPCGMLEAMIESVWSGKTVKYKGGFPPNDHGVVKNNMLGRFSMFEASIYRTIAPIDGKESFAIDYVNDFFLFFLMDFVRKVQKNLYLGIATLRPFFKHPIMFFILEII